MGSDTGGLVGARFIFFGLVIETFDGALGLTTGICWEELSDLFVFAIVLAGSMT